MSFQPPQPPQQPGWGQPGQGGLGFGAPQQAAQGPGAAPPAGRASKPRQFAPAMIIAALVLIAVAVGVVVLAGGGGGGGLDAEGAAEGFAAVVDDADFDGGGEAQLRRCPLGDQAAFAEQVADLLELSDDVLDGTSVAVVQEGARQFPAAVWCYQTETDPRATGDFAGLSLTAGDLPRRGDWADFLDDNLDFYDDVVIDDPQSHRGGQIYAYCFDDGEQPGCGADWVHTDSGLVVGLSYTIDDDDTGPAVDALKQLLPAMLEALADQV